MLGGRVKPSQLRPKVDVAEVTRIVKSPTKTGIVSLRAFYNPLIANRNLIACQQIINILM